MLFRELGRTGLRVSLLSLGTGGPSTFGQSTGLSPQEQDSLVRRSLELGVNLFDTSEGYGESEAALGRALRGVPRDSYYLVTKWSPDAPEGEELPPESLLSTLERSLRRLRTDYVDVMMFHGVTAATYRWLVERYYPALRLAREDGKVRFIGFSNRLAVDLSHESVVMALTEDPELWDAIMLKYGILHQRAAQKALPLAEKHNVGILNMSAVRLKLTRPDQLEELVAEWKRDGTIAGDSVPDEDPLDWLVYDDVESVVSAGYKFGADHPAISTVLTGASNIEHLEKNARALESPRLPDTDKRRLQAVFRDAISFL